MLRKLLAAVFAASLMCGAAWGGQSIIDVGGAGAGDLHSGSVATASATTSNVTATGANTIAIGSSVGGTNLKLGTIASDTGAIFINGGVDTGPTTAFSTGLDYVLTATSITTNGGDVEIINDGTNPSVTALTLTNGLKIVATGTLDVEGVAFTTTGGQVNVGDAMATFTEAIVNISGGSSATLKSIYGGGLDLDTTVYNDGGDVDLGAGSTWGATGDPTKAATVDIVGTVNLAGGGEDLTITGGSEATLGGFAWGAASAAQGILLVDEESTLIINNTTDAVIFTGDAAGTASQSLSIDDASSVVIAGELQFVGGDSSSAPKSALIVGSTNPSTLEAGSLTIGDDTATVTVVINSADLTTKINNVTTINNKATYQVGGVADQYLGGITLGGTQGGTTGFLTGITGADVIITTGDAYVEMTEGGTINATATGNSFTINGAGVKVVNTAAANKALIDAQFSTNGTNIIIEKVLDVNGDLDLKTAANSASSIRVGSYNQINGTVTQTGAGGTFTVDTGALITGATSKFVLIADNTTYKATFTEGLTIANDATLTTTAIAVSGITLGDNETLELKGGVIDASNITGGANTFDVTSIGGGDTKLNVTANGSVINTGAAAFTAGALTVKSTYDSEEASLVVTGTTGTATFADVKVQSGELKLATDVTTNNEFIVGNGGYLTSDKAAGINITATDITKAFTAQPGSNIQLANGDITLNAFAKATVDGSMLVGAAGTNAGDEFVLNTSNLNGATTIGKNAIINLTNDAALAAKAAKDAGDTTTFAVVDSGANELIMQGNPFQNSALGQFEFAKVDDGAGNFTLALVNADGFLSDYDGTPTSREEAHANMQTAWDRFGAGAIIDRSLADAAYDAGVMNPATSLRTAVIDHTDVTWGETNFGQITVDMLKAIAGTAGNGLPYSEGVGKGILRNGDVSEMLNVGIGEIRGITSAIGARNVQLRGQMAGAGDVYYEYANPTLLLNNDYANRIWAGYIGQWEKGDTRNGVSGYDYDSNGFIIGYDRLVGCNFAFGGAFAYSRGDYEDKAALSNSSKIDNYSFNGYATYSALNGVFASLFGGYTHQKNDIQASYAFNNAAAYKNADYDNDYWHIGAQLGYDFQPIDGLVLTPSIGLQYIDGRSDSHFARWGAGANYNGGGYVNSAEQQALLLPIELAAKYDINFSNCSRLTIEGNLGYSYNFMDSDSNADVLYANISNGGALVENQYVRGYDRDGGRHTFNAGAGLRYHFNRFDVGVKYDYYLQSDAHAHRLMGTVGVSF